LVQRVPGRAQPVFPGGQPISSGGESVRGGKDHVGAGVAIGNWIDVQPVDGDLIPAQTLDKALDYLDQGRGLEFG
jgi:hypothetical protein